MEMNTNIGLKTTGKPIEHHVHVNAIRVGPGVLKVFLQPLA